MSRTTAILLLATIIALVAALVVGSVVLVASNGNSIVSDSSGHSAPEISQSARNPTSLAPQTRLGIQKFSPTSRATHLQLLDYQYFTVGYDNERKNPAWVTYDLDGPITHPGPEAKRPAQFATDDRTTAKVHHRDYSNSGLDRGHMCPSYAMFSRYGEEGERATFICTNIVPQPHVINAGLWESDETDIAGRPGKGDGWAGTLRHIAVINGPVYMGARRDLPSGIEIPDAYFSIVFDYLEDTGSYRALAFEVPAVLPSQTATLTPDRFLVSIKHIEDETGLDVYAGVDPAVRAETEATTAATTWP